MVEPVFQDAAIHPFRMPPSEPRFRRLAREGLVTLPTLRALERREPAFEGEPRTLAPEPFATLVALVDRLRPPYPRPTAREIALRIDRRLTDGTGDGWRYDALPPDPEAYAKGLAALAQEGPLDDGLIRRLQRGETTAEWPVSPVRFLQDLLSEVVTYAYSQPEVQDAIGYVGYADAKGWHDIGLGQKEEWE